MHVCGPDDGTPVVLLHGGGATSTVWFANAEALAGTHRAFAPDAVGGPGRSVPAGVGVRTLAGVPHHSMPVENAERLNREPATFLG